MRSFLQFGLSALLVLNTAFAVPTTGNVPVTKHAGPIKENSYIVKLKDNVSKDSHIAQLLTDLPASNVTHKYEDVLHGYAVMLNTTELDYLRKSKDVEYILEDGIFQLESTPGVKTSDLNTNATTSASTKKGTGVDIYGLDTGINTSHEAFGGRARWGKSFGGYAEADGNGHGTHTAGTAVGKGFGLATSAHIIAVKVLADSGSGAYSDIIAGINYVVSSAAASKRPSIATMSLAGPSNLALNSAIQIAVTKGIHFTVAAGNANVDAGDTSPACAAAANTIGAVDTNNAKASFSNFGPSLDAWALGVNVESAWIGSTVATQVLSGTSMATPHVAGILAVMLGEHGDMSPDVLSKQLKEHAKAVVVGAPSNTTNLLAEPW